MKIMLVYQAGIANVFHVERFALTREARGTQQRLLQHSFDACAWYVRGLVDAGAEHVVACCNMAGDIADRQWSYQLDNAPWHDKFLVYGNFNNLQTDLEAVNEAMKEG